MIFGLRPKPRGRAGDVVRHRLDSVRRPQLGAILGLAATSQGTGQGALLLAVYSAGLGLPFLFSAVAFSTAARAFGVFKRHYLLIQGLAGIVLVAMGVLVLTGELFRLNVEIQQLFDRHGLNFFKSV